MTIFVLLSGKISAACNLKETYCGSFMWLLICVFFLLTMCVRERERREIELDQERQEKTEGNTEAETEKGRDYNSLAFSWAI